MTTKISSRFNTDILTNNRISDRPSERTSRGEDGQIVSIILLNDDETYMGYVVNCLVKIFKMSHSHAENTMKIAHTTGDAVVGIYSRGLADELLKKVRKTNTANGENLGFRIER